MSGYLVAQCSNGEEHRISRACSQKQLKQDDENVFETATKRGIPSYPKDEDATTKSLFLQKLKVACCIKGRQKYRRVTLFTVQVKRFLHQADAVPLHGLA